MAFALDENNTPSALRVNANGELLVTGGGRGGSGSGLTDAQLRASPVPVVDSRLPATFLTPGLLAVDTLATITLARQLSAGAESANTALTATCRRISIHARLADIRYAIGTGAQTASGTSHYIAMGERLDLDVPESANIAVIRAGTTDAVLELSELV